MSYLTTCKKTFAMFLAVLVFAVSVVTPADGATTYTYKGRKTVYTDRKSEVYFEGSKLSSPTRYGLYINDNFMIPAKSMLVGKGPRMKYKYNKKSKKIVLTYNGKKLTMKLNSRKIWVNGVRKSKLNTAPLMVKMEGKKVAVVPIKRVCAEFGLDYSYNSTSRLINIARHKEPAKTSSGTVKAPAKPKAAPVTTSTVVNAVRGLQATVFKTLNQAAFIATLGPLARDDYHKTGVLASVTLAQAINESGWGTTTLAQQGNNIFGMKISLSGNKWAGSVWDGRSYVTIKTREEYGGKKVWIKAKFRKYNSVSDSIADHSAYLVNAMNGKNKRYAGLNMTKNYVQQLNIIKKGEYCTWSSYVPELTKLIKKYNLTQYDR